MAVHKRLRKTGRKLLAHVRRGRQALQRRGKGRGDAGDPHSLWLDESLSDLAGYVSAGNHFESPWQLFRFGQLKGISDEEAVPAVAAWCKRQGLQMSFVERRVRHVGVLFLVLKVKSPAR
jgi:hypothetical protein